MILGKLSKTAFTLIELLVVIAIIGILSGLIIVGMSSSIQSANIAKAQIFSVSLRDSMLASFVSEWKFDDSSSVGLDSWSSNNCTVNGAPSVYSGSNCVYGSCLDFNGTTDYLNCNAGTNIHQAGNFTVEAWVNLSAQPSHGSDSMIIGDYNGGYRGYKFSIDSSYRVYFLVGRLSDTSSSSMSSLETLSINKWYHVAVSYDGRLNTFVNGSKTLGPTYGPIEKEISNTLIGKAQWWAQYFNGTIDNIRFYSSAVSTSKIKEQYYAGMNHLLAKEAIEIDEYKEEISSDLAAK